MAKENTSGIPELNNSFQKGMVKDTNGAFIGEGLWTHARNLVNNSHDGQLGVIGNEPSNLMCISLPYTLIGCIPSAVADEWILFTTDDTNSEIGVFNELKCGTNEAYTTIVNDPCLNFNTHNLITGASRKTFDCSVKVYWSDGNNPDRILDINNIPWKKQTTINGGCITYTNLPFLDCDQLRLAPLLTVPCLRLEKATGSGSLINGTYSVAVAYMVNEIRVTDYLMVSNHASIWGHSGVGGAIKLTITNTDQDFTELEVVVISVINGQTTAKRLGVYSTHQSDIYIDSIDPTLSFVPIDRLPIITPAIDKSDGIFPLNNYLLRVGTYSKVDFNYQPLANQIQTHYVENIQPHNYYSKGGVDVGYMRDEVYSFFIRWIYNTGDKSASYHIPGNINPANGSLEAWISSEKYPDDNPSVWNSFPLLSGNAYNLCGQNIRHHKFPANNNVPHFNGQNINILGVRFTNILPPKALDGTIITNIVGYEILRGSREGQKSIIAKGMINNMKDYNILEIKDEQYTSTSAQRVLMQNYPYNDITGNDPFYLSDVGMAVNNNYVSFHSPDTTFQNPYIGTCELQVYGTIHGLTVRDFVTPYKHPRFKIVGQLGADTANTIAALLTLFEIFGVLVGNAPDSLDATEDMPYTLRLGMTTDSPDINILGTNAGAVFYTAKVIMNVIISAAMIGAFGIKQKAKKLLDLIRGLIPLKQYASQINSYGYYGNFIPNPTQLIDISDYGYVKDGVQSLGGRTINNLYRNPYLALHLNSPVINPSVSDWSLTHFSKVFGCIQNNPISSLYGAIKIDFQSQYGQLDSIRQIPISNCVHDQQTTSSPVLFGGDTYINRYTEKNNFMFFNDWLLGQPDDYLYDYRNYQNILGTAYWVNNTKTYEDAGLVSTVTAGSGQNVFSKIVDGFFVDVNGQYSMVDCFNEDVGQKDGAPGWYAKEKYKFYLSCNGVKDFYVESEVNVGYRDHGDEISKMFYDPYGFSNLYELFRSDIIKLPSFFKYDYSLSVSKTYSQFITWGSLLPRSFNPEKAESCYTYNPRRINYSLPQSEELKRDNWQSFLVNNYKDMPDEISSVKPINKTGALIMLKTKSPIQIAGSDTLKTDSGIKVTIGDGGLFSQPLQSLVNSDEIYQYGSCQNRWSIASTMHGIFYVSQEQGKVFNYSGQLEEISNSGMKWWFSRYLPSNLKRLYPNYKDVDNPVIGSGVLVVYDNINEIVYFTKKDYIPKVDLSYSPGSGFYLDTNEAAEIQDPYSFSTFDCPAGYELFNGTCTLLQTSAAVPDDGDPVPSTSTSNRDNLRWFPVSMSGQAAVS